MVMATANWLAGTVTDVAEVVGMTLSKSRLPNQSVVIRCEVEGLVMVVMAVPTFGGVWSWLRGA